MIVLGILLLVIALAAGIPALWYVGVILLVAGLILLLLGAVNHPVGPRRFYY